MARNLQKFDLTDSTLANYVPWAQSGATISNNMSIDEMLRAADLDWEVIRIRPTYEYNGEIYKDIRDTIVCSKDGRPFDKIPQDWHLTQNREAFEFFMRWIEAGHMRLVAAGNLDHRRLVWVLAEIINNVEGIKGDRYNNFLLFSLPHKYGAAIDIRQINYRIFCNNQMAFALSKSGGGLRIRWNHRSKFEAAQVQETISIANHQFGQYQNEVVKFLASRRYKADMLADYFRELFPVAGADENSKLLSPYASRLIDLTETSPGHQVAPGTWYNAINALSFSTTHVMGRSPATRLKSAWYGQYRKLTLSGVNLALEYANKS